MIYADPFNMTEDQARVACEAFKAALCEFGRSDLAAKCWAEPAKRSDMYAPGAWWVRGPVLTAHMEPTRRASEVVFGPGFTPCLDCLLNGGDQMLRNDHDCAPLTRARLAELDAHA